MNRLRIFTLIKILMRKSDMDHKLSLNEIISLLEAEGIEHVNRKTLYDDFRFLQEIGFQIEYDDGYFLCEVPFSLSEIKILTDSLNGLKSIDERFAAKLKDKLYSFLSEHEIDDLKKLEFANAHKDAHFINRLEDALESIRHQRMMIITRNHKKEEIFPVFLHRNNDLYYLYYHYPGNPNIYHVRFDNIGDTVLSDEKDDLSISKEKILAQIEESSSSFHSKQTQTIRFEIIEDSDYLRSRLTDDFPNLIFTKDGFSIRASVSDAFFARLTSYKDKIKISDPEIADQYISFLESILTRNKKD